MAWVTPFTASAGGLITAVKSNETRDNLMALLPLNALAWSSWTPTLTQSGTITKTVTYAKYTQFGKLVVFIMKLAVTGAGTGNNKVIFSIPVTAAANFSAVQLNGGGVFDTSGGITYPGFTELESTTTAAIQDSTQAPAAASNVLGVTGAAFSAALASGDIVLASGMYEAA